MASKKKKKLREIRELVAAAKRGEYACNSRDFGRGVSLIVGELEKILDDR